jgi:hypothetical protein
MLTGLSEAGGDVGALAGPPPEFAGTAGEVDDGGTLFNVPCPGSMTRSIRSRPTRVVAGVVSRYGLLGAVLGGDAPIGLLALPLRPALPGTADWPLPPAHALEPVTVLLRAGKFDADGPGTVAATGMLIRSPVPANVFSDAGVVEVLGNPKLPPGGR